jgi:glycosyltransferase involved in cell wall biosynthesis
VASHLFPWLKAKASVIHIGSNIPFREPQQADTDVAYFGLIRPVKGIEEFIATLSRPCFRPALRIRVIGEVSPGYESYASEMIPRLEALGAEILLNRSAGEVSELLSRAKIALLPFPDGMSRRRGSALAAMGNGALVVTNAGSAETDLFRNVCAMPADNSSLLEVLSNALEHYDSYESIRCAGQEFARSNSWDGIGKTYVSVFERLSCAQR